MGKKLVIAEKPAVAQSIAKVLEVTEKKDGYFESSDYIISWCVGHLVGLDEPESYGEEYKKWDRLPIIPENYNYKVKEGTKKQYETLKKLMNSSDVESLVCATDAGREGELIFRHVYNMGHCRKPFYRLWISSMEDTAIKQGFAELKNGSDYDNLYKSALCRERADWLVGMNATRFITTLYNSSKVLSIGRVQTPTLAMIVQRDNDIANFKKEKYYTVAITSADGSFTAESHKITDISEAEKIKESCKTTEVFSVKDEEKKINPPKLYDLTSLQRHANKLFGFTAQQTMESVQRLYDNKLATYPRTDSQYLTEDMEDTAKNIIGIIKNKMEFAQKFTNEANIKPVMNNKKVSDHHAIIPTASIEKSDLSKLTDTDRKILYMLGARLLAATSQAHIYKATTAVFTSDGIAFTAKGKNVLDNGFKAVEQSFMSFLRCKDEDEKKETILPQLTEGEHYDVSADILEHYTQLPKPYIEDTLLSAMEKAGNKDYDTDEVERKGLGTPATRAGIIETLISRDFISRNKKQLLSTEKGKSIIKAVPDTLKSPKMTAEWENKLVLISKGQLDSDEFMTGIADFVKSIISETTAVSDMKDIFSDREVIGKCPRCHSNIYEGKLNFYCENKDCEFALWKKNKFWESKKKEITKSAAKTLLSKGKVHFKDLYSDRTGNTYEADILLDDTGGKYVNFKLEFPKRDDKK